MHPIFGLHELLFYGFAVAHSCGLAKKMRPLTELELRESAKATRWGAWPSKWWIVGAAVVLSVVHYRQRIEFGRAMDHLNGKINEIRAKFEY